MPLAEADEIGFDWVCFLKLVVHSSLFLVIDNTELAIIFGVLEIGFVLHISFFLIDLPLRILLAQAGGAFQSGWAILTCQRTLPILIIDN